MGLSSADDAGFGEHSHDLTWARSRVDDMLLLVMLVWREYSHATTRHSHGRVRCSHGEHGGMSLAPAVDANFLAVVK